MMSGLVSRAWLDGGGAPNKTHAKLPLPHFLCISHKAGWY
jgi:hypothetical protein